MWKLVDLGGTSQLQIPLQPLQGSANLRRLSLNVLPDVTATRLYPQSDRQSFRHLCQDIALRRYGGF